MFYEYVSEMQGRTADFRGECYWNGVKIHIPIRLQNSFPLFSEKGFKILPSSGADIWGRISGQMFMEQYGLNFASSIGP